MIDDWDKFIGELGHDVVVAARRAGKDTATLPSGLFGLLMAFALF